MAKKTIVPSRQIHVRKTDKSVFEIINKLKPASDERADHLFYDEGEGAKSTIGLTIVDCSVSPSVTLSANISPEDVSWIREHIVLLDMYKMDGELIPPTEGTKILEHKVGADGYAPVTKLSIARHQMRGEQPARYPWTITIENGKARVAKDSAGKTTAGKGSYKCEHKASVFMTDKEMYTRFLRAEWFIQTWLTTYGPEKIAAGEKACDEYWQNRQNAQYNQPEPVSPQQYAHYQSTMQYAGQTPGQAYPGYIAPPAPQVGVPQAGLPQGYQQGYQQFAGYTPAPVNPCPGAPGQGYTGK